MAVVRQKRTWDSLFDECLFLGYTLGVGIIGVVLWLMIKLCKVPQLNRPKRPRT